MSDTSQTLRRAKIVIPTTGVPTEIIRIERLPPETNSGLFIEGTSVEAGIAVHRDYNSFVRYASGVVERLYAHKAFRLDVSASITSGDSWKLGVLLAHAYEAAGQLYQRLRAGSPPAEVLVWVTGDVRSVDLAVASVGHIESKLRQTLPLLREARADGLDVVILLPRDNLAEIPAPQAAEFERLGIRVATIADAIEAFEVLGLPAPQAAASKPAPSWTGSPYRGLEAYEAEHRTIFFGRGRAREECVELLRSAAAHNRAFLMVHGRSGAGKSSLALAGIAGDVMERAHEGGAWSLATVRFSASGADPVDAIAGAVAAALALDVAQTASFTAGLHDDPAAAARLLSVPGGKRRSVMLVADQFEQALLGANPGKPVADKALAEKGEALGKALLALCESGHVWIVATMRTDKLDLLDTAPSLARLARDDRTYRLEQPSLSEISEIITQPAGLAGYKFEKGEGADLPGELAEIALASPDSLPLLQIVLLRLAELAGPDRRVTYESFRRIGGFDGAVGSWAEKTEAELVAAGASSDAVDRVLANLVRIDPETGRALSRPTSADAEPAARRIIDVLLAARLLVTDGEGASSEVRLAHEMLTRVWARLRDLVPRLRDGLLLRDRLETRAAEWIGSNKDDALLLRGPARIAAAAELLGAGLLDIDKPTQALVKASQAVAERERTLDVRRARTRFRVVAGIAAVLVGITGWSVYATVVATSQSAELKVTQAAAIAAAQESELRGREIAARSAEIAAIAAPGEVAKGRIDSALTALIDVGVAVDPSQLPPRFVLELAQTLEASRWLRMFRLPEGSQVLKSGRQIFTYNQGSGELQLFNDVGVPERLPVTGLSKDRLVNLRMLSDNGLVLVWADGAVQRFGLSQGAYRESWAVPASSAFLMNASIGAKGDVYLNYMDAPERVIAADGEYKQLDLPDGTVGRVSLPEDGGQYFLTNKPGVNRFAMAELAIPKGTTGASETLVEEARHNSLALGLCDGDAHAPTAAAANRAAADIAFSITDWVSPFYNFDCLATRSGLLLSAWEGDYQFGEFARDLQFVTGLGDRVSLLTDALAHIGLGSNEHGTTKLPLAFDADPDTGLIAVVLGEKGLLLRMSQRPARSTLVARFAVPYGRTAVKLLSDGRLLLVNTLEGVYRLVSPPSDALSPLLEATPWDGNWSSVTPLHETTCGLTRDNGEPLGDETCYSVASSGLRAEASAGGVRLIDAAGTEPLQLTTEPARTVFFASNSDLIVTTRDNQVRRWSQTRFGIWQSTLIYRSETTVLSAEPDTTGRYLLLADNNSTDVVYRLYSFDTGALVVTNLSTATFEQSAHFDADGNIIMSGLSFGSGDRQYQRLKWRDAVPLLQEAQSWLDENDAYGLYRN